MRYVLSAGSLWGCARKDLSTGEIEFGSFQGTQADATKEKPALRARMRLRVGFLQTLDGHMGVNLGGGKIGMPK